MKKARKVIFLVFICVALSFFSSIYAASTSMFDVGSNNVTAVDEVNSKNTKITGHVSMGSAPQGDITFAPTSTGIYTIDVTGIQASPYPGKDLCYIITNSRGEQLRLAAYYNPEISGYATYTDTADNSSTSIDVVLAKDETYTLKLAYKATPSSTGGMYTMSNGEVIYQELDYEVTLLWNEQANSQPSYQSNIPANRVSEDNRFAGTDNMEPVNDSYTAPTDQETTLTNTNPNTALEEWLLNPMEEAIVDLMLLIGDHLILLINAIVGEDVTITNLIYNNVDAVNPNFFDVSTAGAGITSTIKPIISEWYNIFSGIAIAIYLLVLLAIGINVLLGSTSAGLGKAKSLLLDWAKGLFCIIFIPYVIKYAFLINEAVVDMLESPSEYDVGSTGTVTGNDEEQWSAEDIEFRSPEFVSKYTGQVAFGSDDVTQSYAKKIPSYEQDLDLMRLMRAYTGLTKKFIYAVIWYILFGQLIVFIVQYYKRYFMIAFLIVTFPIICIFNSISIAQGKPAKDIGSWMKEILTNIFIQLVHAIIYTIITGICISIVKVDLASSATLNWIIIIMAINFISEGEKLLRKIISAMGNTAGGTAGAAQGIKGIGKKIKHGMHRLTTGTEPKD